MVRVYKYTERNCLLYICVYYLEWLNELVRFVVNGSYDRLFIENPNLRNFVNKNHDDSQSIEIMNKLNNDPELVEIYLKYIKTFLVFSKAH
jgi:hypothetical protein